jgi:hypothetical protein
VDVLKLFRILERIIYSESLNTNIRNEGELVWNTLLCFCSQRS